jgi:hypothetical protein
VPAAPTDLFVFGGNQKVELDWSRPANGGSPITGYVIVPTKNGVAQTAVNVGTSTFTTLTGLTNGASYTFTVAAVNAVGQGPASAPSQAVVPAPTVPGAPTITSATPGDGTVALAWSAPTDDGGQPVTGYTVSAYRFSDDQLVKSQPAAGLSTTVNGLANGTGYYFTVAAVNSIGTGDADVSAVVTPTPVPPTVPGAPTGVTAAQAGATSATVSWTAPASDGNAAITHYVVTPRIGGTPQPGLAVTTGNVLSTTVTGLAKGTSYTFTVHAVNSVGAGPESAASAVLAIPATAPGAPAAAPTATAGDGQATVSWAAPADSGGSALTGYDVLVSPHRTGQTDPDVVHFADTATSHAVTGLTNGTAYTFQVRGVNAAGAGAYSPASTAVTPQTPPAQPVTGLAVTPSVDAAGHPMITATWTLPAGDAGAHVCYTVNVAGAGNESCSGDDIPAGSPQTKVFTGAQVAPGAPYAVTVFGYDSGTPRGFASPQIGGLNGTSVTIGKNAKINAGKSTTVSGTLKDMTTAGTPALANKSVELWKRASSTAAWTKAATVTTNASGVASSLQKPTANTQYEFRYQGVSASGGGTGFGAAASAVEQVTVTQVVSVTATATKIAHGKTVKFYGTVSPSKVGQFVNLQQKSGTKWKTLTIKAKIVRQKMPNGKTVVGYVLSLTPHTPGTFTYRIAGPRTSTNAQGFSAALTLKVT